MTSRQNCSRCSLDKTSDSQARTYTGWPVFLCVEKQIVPRQLVALQRDRVADAKPGRPHHQSLNMAERVGFEPWQLL
jgi:hypothetical protein